MRNWKKILSLLLVLGMVLGLVPMQAQAKGPVQPESRVLTEADFAAADVIYDALYSADSVQTASTASRGEAIYHALLGMEGVVTDTVRYQGNDRVVWETEEGVACVWSARLEEIAMNAVPMETDLPDEVTINYGTRGVNHGVDVYVVQPYYGIDSSFTTQYANEGKRVAQVTGGTYYYKKTTAATIDFVAEAISKGGVVFFDSHGDTDYERGDDHTSGALTSYLCLQTGTGLTNADYAYDSDLGTYHAVYYRGYGSMNYYEVDGTVIANHMTKNSNNGLLWAAICLGMATDGLHAPLRAKGLGVAYGYSQSVSFDGDYCFEEEFFDTLCTGKTVAESITAMKDRYGKWDFSLQIGEACGWSSDWCCATEAEARADYAAFPIVVSDQDVYPGHGNVDKVQNVYSTWKLIDSAGCNHNYERMNVVEPTCVMPGYSGDQICTLCGDEIPGEVVPAKGHSYGVGQIVPPTCEEEGYTVYSCMVCGALMHGNPLPALGHDLRFVNYVAPTCTEEGHGYDEACVRCGKVFNEGPVLPALGHTWGDWTVIQEPQLHQPGVGSHTCTVCGETETQEIHGFCPASNFPDVNLNSWYHNAVDFVVDRGIMKGTGTGFAPNKTMTRAELATIFWNLEGKPEPEGTNPFSDVKDSFWGAKAITWAAEQGIVSGVGSGKYNPNGTVTREQVAVMLQRYARDSVPPADFLVDFSDASEASPWALEALNWAVACGYLRGSNGKLNPRGSMQRCEVAQLLLNYLG